MLPAIDSALLLQTEEGIVEALRESFDTFAREAALQAPRLLAALVVFAVFLTVGLIARRVLRAALGRAPMAPRIRLLVVRLIFFTIVGLGVVALLGVATGASVGRLFAGFGLISVGLGFALKSPLENMFSGILTILVSPFRIGDEIEVSGYAGRVETINIHDTIIRTFDGKRVAIPNVEVYLNAITNQTAYSERRYDVLVGIHYNDDLRQALKVAREVLDSTEGVLALPRPLVLVGEFGESSVNLILRFWSDPTMQAQYRVISEVTANVKVAFDEAEITIPFPIRTIHIPEGGEKGAGELRVRTTGENGQAGGRGATNP
jgi:small conductance mechanosensitive channel